MEGYNKINLKKALELMLFRSDCYYKSEDNMLLIFVWEDDSDYYMDSHGDIYELHEILDYDFYKKISDDKK